MVCLGLCGHRGLLLRGERRVGGRGHGLARRGLGLGLGRRLGRSLRLGRRRRRGCRRGRVVRRGVVRGGARMPGMSRVRAARVVWQGGEVVGGRVL